MIVEVVDGFMVCFRPKIIRHRSAGLNRVACLLGRVIGLSHTSVDNCVVCGFLMEVTERGVYCKKVTRQGGDAHKRVTEVRA